MQSRFVSAACVFISAAVYLSGCAVKTAETVRIVNESSTFAIDLLTSTKEIDFSDYQDVPGFGVTGYYDKKYQTQDGTPVEECYVLYSVTAYPDYSISTGEYVTAIEVTDPEIEVCGYSVGDSAQVFQAHLEETGFTLYDSTERIKRFENGNVLLRFSVEPETQTVQNICVEVKVSNYLGVIF